MGKVYDSIDDKLAAWVAGQHVFFVATAPLGADGHINNSPKGGDSFRVISGSEVAYQGYVQDSRVRGRPYGPPLPSEPGMRVSPHRAQASIRRRKAPGGPQRVAFTIRGCTELTQSAHRAFNGAEAHIV